MTTNNKSTTKISYQRLLEVLHRYVDTDWNAMGNSEPIYRILTEECGCTHDELIAMGFDWLPQVKESDHSAWFLTDSDSFQICREHSDGSFEFYQISLISENCPRRFAVSHDLVYTDRLSDEELKTICDCYGFSSSDDVQKRYGDQAARIFAEFWFELSALDCVLQPVYPSFEDAKRAICMMSGFLDPMSPL